MNRLLGIAVLVTLTAMSGCASSQGVASKTPPTTPSAAATPTPAALNTGPNALALGETREGTAISNTLIKIDRDYRESDTVENDPGSVWFGMYVKTCVTGDLEGETNTLWWENFVPLTASGSSYPNDDGAYGGFPDEQYPFGKELTSGCRKGWIITQVPKGEKITQVDYAPESAETLAEWKTP